MHGSLEECDEEIFALRTDINELLHVNNEALCFNLDRSNSQLVVPAIFYGQSDILLPIGWFSKAWKNTKKFIKKHKKAIIIGAVVVVATAVVVTAAITCSAASAASAAAAGSSGTASTAGTAAAATAAVIATQKRAEEEQDDDSPPTQKISNDVSSHSDEDLIEEEISETQEVLYENISLFKEYIQEDEDIQELLNNEDVQNDTTFLEKAQNLGSMLAHETFGAISEISAGMPLLAQEMKDLSYMLLPEGMLPEKNIESELTPLRNFQELVAMGHENIDSLFSTDFAEHYTPEAKENSPLSDFVIGILPFPGSLISSRSININRFAKLGQAADRAGLTKAGRGLMKHGYRKDSVFPKPVGNPAQINAHGQKILEEILNHPERQVIKHVSKKYGPVIDIKTPNGGVRYSGDGKIMMGFLEPDPF